jgi:tryptophan-rich sensory protein
MGIAFYLAWENKWVVKNKTKIIGKIKLGKFFDKIGTGKWQKQGIITIFFIQLFLNICWSVIFFGKHSIGFAFFELLILWISILATIISFYRVSKTASYLLLPYIFWVSFAGVLNFALWILN